MNSSETIVSVSIPTKYGLNIYSSKIIDNYNFYVQTLRNSGLIIQFKCDEEIIETLNINKILDLCENNTKNDELVYYYKELHGKRFNSTIFSVFDIIEETYKTVNGFDIYDGPVFKKYNELFRKIKIIERQTSELWRKLNTMSRTKITDGGYLNNIQECNNLLEQDPFQNESMIITRLEEIIGKYRKCELEEKKEKEQKELDEKKKEEDELRKGLTIKKNRFGQYIYEKYNLVFDPVNRYVVGVSNGLGSHYELDIPHVRLCQKLKLNYKI